MTRKIVPYGINLNFTHADKTYFEYQIDHAKAEIEKQEARIQRYNRKIEVIG